MFSICWGITNIFKELLAKRLRAAYTLSNTLSNWHLQTKKKKQSMTNFGFDSKMKHERLGEFIRIKLGKREEKSTKKNKNLIAV